MNELESFESALRFADMGLASRLNRRARTKRRAWKFVMNLTVALKRTIDVVAAGSALIVLSPVFAGFALAVRLNSKGGAFFGQERAGLYGRHFKMWKFRSMYIDAEERKKELMEQNEMSGGVLFKMKDDPRITRVGKILRKTSIDELPQLWNVFCGDMSLVGPRPPVPQEVAEYTLSDRRRLEVKPGITCIWQVTGRSNIPFDQQVELDVQYIHSQGLLQDIRILFMTIPAVLFGRGAY
jgi:lipopolysaccharide/colanic/teichoic acid biosynthesis glycosyltransferase